MHEPGTVPRHDGNLPGDVFRPARCVEPVGQVFTHDASYNSQREADCKKQQQQTQKCKDNHIAIPFYMCSKPSIWVYKDSYC